MRVLPVGPATHETGTLTVNDYAALAGVGAAFTLNSNTASEGLEWIAETSNDVTAQNIAAAIIAFTAMSCTAVAVANVVHITRNPAGFLSTGLSTTDNVALTRSGIQLSGGSDTSEIGYLISSAPVYVKNVLVKCDIGDGVVTIYNGTSTSGTEYDVITGVNGETVSRAYKKGFCLPAGCYVFLNENAAQVTIEYSRI